MAVRGARASVGTAVSILACASAGTAVSILAEQKILPLSTSTAIFSNTHFQNPSGTLHAYSLEGLSVESGQTGHH